MATYSPQYSSFKIVNSISLATGIIFWAIFGFSIIPVAFKEYCDRWHILHAIDILNMIGISIFFALELIRDYILIPLTDKKRRDDFIDNSFGSSFSTNSSVDYFDNEEVSQGLYKAAVNLFENCFFTLSLVKEVTLRRIIVPVVMLIFMVVFSYYGFEQVPFALSVLQALFSANILGGLIKHLILQAHLENIQNSWITLFQHSDLKSDTTKYYASIYRYWLEYESLHSRINAEIPEKVYKKYNPPLTAEWVRIKARYNIR